MRLTLDPRAARWLRRLPRTSVYSGLELVLLTLLAVQAARLIWVLVTPVGPIGDWRLPAANVDSARRALTGGFDPFFRLREGGPAVVTSLQLKLFGIRVDEATGRGSAIIAGPDALQNSFGVGDEVQPGVKLKAVNFDSVVITRDGADETLFLDQSTPAPVAAPPSGPVSDSILSASPVAASLPLSADQLRSGVGFSPRTAGGRITGLAVRPQGDGAAFRKAGFRDGDVVVQIAGRPVGSPADIERAVGAAAAGGTISVSVERGSDVLPIAIPVGGK